MKKIMLFAVSCVALAACTKEQQLEQSVDSEKGQVYTLTVYAPSQTKATSAAEDNGDISFKWQEGDEIAVTVGSDAPVTFTAGEPHNDGSADFTGSLDLTGKTFSVQFPATDPDLTSQDYLSGEPLPRNMMKFTASNCTSGSISLNPASAVLRLNLWGGQTLGKIVVTNLSSEESTKPSYTLAMPSGGTAIGATKDKATPFYIVVPAEDFQFSAETFDTNGKSIDKVKGNIKGTSTGIANMPELKVVEGSAALPGFFSVSATKKVRFSKGNLYYDGSSFKFENNQLDFANTWKSDHVSHFRWANNSGTLSSDIASAISTETGLTGSTNDIFFTNATADTPRTDFTVDGQTGVWRTLSKDEWSYLLSTRIVNGGTGEGKSYQRATINSDVTDIYGLIIYPDGYESQTTATSYTLSDWSSMESAGCVFLPAAGYRENIAVYNVGVGGTFWSSPAYMGDFVYNLYFDSKNFRPNAYNPRSSGHCVRLVFTAQ